MKTPNPIKTLLVTTILATLMVGSGHAANLLVNGSFETNNYVAPIIGGNAFGPYSPTLGSSSINNWSWSPTVAPYPGAVRLLNETIDSGGASGGVASDGIYAVSLEGNASWISQNVTLGAGQYQLSFDASQWLPSALPVNPIYASLGGVNFSFDNSTAAFSPSAGYQNYTSGVFTLATAGTYEFKIAANNPVAGSTAGTAVDNVVLSAVPEPSTYALVLGGIATLLLIRRRIQA